MERCCAALISSVARRRASWSMEFWSISSRRCCSALLIIASASFVARLVETSLREVDKGVIEAAQSMGCSPFQIIWKVILPESLPSLVASFTTAFITILGYGAMAGAIGGGGLGKIAINYGYYRFNVVLEFFATALLVVLVQILQTAGTKLAIKCDKRIQK